MIRENYILLNRHDAFGRQTVFESSQMPLCKIVDILNLGPPVVFELFMILTSKCLWYWLSLLFSGGSRVIFVSGASISAIGASSPQLYILLSVHRQLTPASCTTSSKPELWSCPWRGAYWHCKSLMAPAPILLRSYGSKGLDFHLPLSVLGIVLM